MSAVSKVVIVGGGTAGWMAAALLSRLFEKLLTIVLIESDEIGTVGVGEATIPQILNLVNVLGIDENEFLAQTQGTIKLGIQFNNWGAQGDTYIHAFGAVGRPLGMLEFHHYWLRARAEGWGGDIAAYSLNSAAALQNRYEPFEQFGETGLSGLVRAYHFDAGLVTQFLRGPAEARGVQRIEGKIVDTQLRGDDGFVESVRLENGTVIEGDLFLDCSGFRGLLIEEALQTGYESWGHWLPCDRAVAVPCATVDPLLPYTQSTARDAGWQWRIPLQQRTGNGHVFCSDYVSEDEATQQLLQNLDGEPLGEPRVLRFNTGRRRKFWNKNCVALGLASGFLEPLESTSIHLVQSGLSRLINLFPHRGISETLTDEYNRQCIYEFERIRDFIILHYHANQRDDSQFWIDCRNMSVPDALLHKIRLFQDTGLLQEDSEDLFKNVAWLQVMLGQRIEPRSYHRMADTLAPQQLHKFVDGIQQLVARKSTSFADHREYINSHCPAARPA